MGVANGIHVVRLQTSTGALDDASMARHTSHANLTEKPLALLRSVSLISQSMNKAHHLCDSRDVTGESWEKLTLTGGWWAGAGGDYLSDECE